MNFPYDSGINGLREKFFKSSQERKKNEIRDKKGIKFDHMP